MWIRILTQKKLHRMLKGAYERGLNAGSRIPPYLKTGGILAGYDMDRDILEIQRKAAKQ